MKALTWSGVAAAAVLGAVCALAGPGWIALLLIFFLTGTLLSRFRESWKSSLTGPIVAKTGPRDAWQVMANGGMFGAAALGSLTFRDASWMTIGAAAIAASAADTWATEIGTLSRVKPRSIINFREVTPGTSGGVSPLGLASAAVGAAVMAAVASLAGWPGAAVAAGFIGGLAGSVVDSLLGATLQAKRWCDECGMETERSIHVCGTTTVESRGISWMNNDAVNAIGSLSGAVVGAFFAL